MLRIFRRETRSIMWGVAQKMTRMSRLNLIIYNLKQGRKPGAHIEVLGVPRNKFMSDFGGHYYNPVTNKVQYFDLPPVHIMCRCGKVG